LGRDLRLEKNDERKTRRFQVAFGQHRAMFCSRSPQKSILFQLYQVLADGKIGRSQ
jgi:hypothetical protein